MSDIAHVSTISFINIFVEHLQHNTMKSDVERYTCVQVNFARTKYHITYSCLSFCEGLAYFHFASTSYNYM